MSRVSRLTEQILMSLLGTALAFVLLVQPPHVGAQGTSDILGNSISATGYGYSPAGLSPEKTQAFFEIPDNDTGSGTFNGMWCNKLAGITKCYTRLVGDDGSVYDGWSGGTISYNSPTTGGNPSGIYLDLNTAGGFFDVDGVRTHPVFATPGVASLQGLGTGYKVETSNYTVDSGVTGGGTPDATIACSSSSADVTITLTSASGALNSGTFGKRLLTVVDLSAAHNCLVAPAGSDAINGSTASLALAPNESTTIQSNGSNGWNVVTDYLPPARVELTNAQILALPTTPVTIVSAPPIGYFIKVLSVTYYTNTSGGAYTNINTTYADLHMTLSSYFASYEPVNDSTTTPTLTLLTQMFATVGSTIYEVGQPNQTAYGSAQGYVIQANVAGIGSAGQPLQIAMNNNGSGNLTGGNSANYLLVVVNYKFEKATP